MAKTVRLRDGASLGECRSSPWATEIPARRSQHKRSGSVAANETIVPTQTVPLVRSRTFCLVAYGKVVRHARLDLSKAVLSGESCDQLAFTFAWSDRSGAYAVKGQVGAVDADRLSSFSRLEATVVLLQLVQSPTGAKGVELRRIVGRSEHHHDGLGHDLADVRLAGATGRVADDLAPPLVPPPTPGRGDRTAAAPSSRCLRPRPDHREPA